MDTKKIWFVTGASKGLGLSLVKAVLAEGHSVAATSRQVAELQRVIGPENHAFLPLEVDLVNEKSVEVAITKTLQKFGRVDVTVNNAGYGQLGTLEELTDAESRLNFDANVFGSLNVIRAIMPHFRTNKSGLVINIASIAGLAGDFAGWGIYCATKFAVVGFTEALAAEAKEFGVKATVVYPGYFRTNFLNGSSLRTPNHKIESYTTANQLRVAHEQQINGNQPGNPDKAALALMELTRMENPPIHLVLGSDAIQIAQSKLKTLQSEISDFETLSTSTDY
jgi:NAD(P)-dependent dehydrogenase (short-subunit alcohol dehydrogenase family)